MITADEARKISNDFAKKYMVDLENTIKKAAYDGKTSLILEHHDKINDELVDNIPIELLENIAEQLQDNGFRACINDYPLEMIIRW